MAPRAFPISQRSSHITEYKICDLACGTGGFLLAAHDYIAEHYQLDRAEKKLLQNGTLFGIELVDSMTRVRLESAVALSAMKAQVEAALEQFAEIAEDSTGK